MVSIVMKMQFQKETSEENYLGGIMCMILRVMKMQSSCGGTFWVKINVKFCWYLMPPKISDF
ncbi:hypothetical protein HanRHA438_Chr10g0473371 [Helianthus annuus]|nr:hypothetical protein HanRHA438_Chr10g0473371 [Helianthus annuus]KAJ0885414.1 hypothetical protein HanPSC8_Chr10g0444951 [Helianthus annuus]